MSCPEKSGRLLMINDVPSIWDEPGQKVVLMKKSRYANFNLQYANRNLQYAIRESRFAIYESRYAIG